MRPDMSAVTKDQRMPAIFILLFVMVDVYILERLEDALIMQPPSY